MIPSPAGNAATIIGFTNPKSQFVTLKICDILGREVESLLDVHLQAGTYTITWNAEYKASGVYFYRIQTADQSETSDYRK